MNTDNELPLGTNDELTGTCFSVPGYEATNWSVVTVKDGWAWCSHEGSRQYFNAASVRLWQTSSKKRVNEESGAGTLKTSMPAPFKTITSPNKTKDNMSKETKPKSVGSQLVADCKNFADLKSVLLQHNPNADPAFIAKQESQTSFGLQKMAVGAALTRFKTAV